MLAAFAQVRARLKQREEEEEEESLREQQQQQSPEGRQAGGAGSYLWWAEALPDSSSGSDGASPPPQRPPCPPDTAELGRAAWTVLHSVAAYYPLHPAAEDREALRGLVRGLARLYPCAECRSHLPAELAAADRAAPAPLLQLQLPLGSRAEEGEGDRLEDAASSRALAERWMCELHNAVNAQLGKPPYDCARVAERWRDGWRDGSCG